MTTVPDTVGEIMTTDIVSVRPDDPVESAVRAMVDRDIGSVLVVDEGRAVGVFTERDLTRGILGEAEFMSRRVGDAMSSPVLSTSSDVDISEAFDLMNAQNVRRLAVVDEDKLVGIVTERDLLRWVSAVTAE